MTESSLKNDDDKVIKGFRNEKSPAQLWAERKTKQNRDRSARKMGKYAKLRTERNFELQH